MSQAKPMPTLRRAMPGMPASSPPPIPTTAELKNAAAEHDHDGAEAQPAVHRRGRREPSSAGRPQRRASERWRSADYSSTRLANFRLPVDLHDRYRELVREVERSYPRLRRPSLTEVIIALLEEGPQTPEQAAELLRRRRAAENAQEART